MVMLLIARPVAGRAKAAAEAALMREKGWVVAVIEASRGEDDRNTICRAAQWLW